MEDFDWQGKRGFDDDLRWGELLPGKELAQQACRPRGGVLGAWSGPRSGEAAIRVGQAEAATSPSTANSGEPITIDR